MDIHHRDLGRLHGVGRVFHDLDEIRLVVAPCHKGRNEGQEGVRDQVVLARRE
ncbi:hypothetical protein [Streptomyces sp. CS227]|uniref:hypothetical protein n=1 Tax=Streptomyces sp. CS227 TaxID=1982763 RepID=UPI0015C5E965|nr:hypothetical protein [Streptomyces sp. CS227]